MTRYLSPDSSEPSRRNSEAHRTYSGIDSSSKPMNSVTRFWAETSTAIPSTLNSSSEWYSPCPASRGAARAPRQQHGGDRRRRRRSGRGSAPGRRSRSAPEMIDAWWSKRDDLERRSRAPSVDDRQQRHDPLAHDRASAAARRAARPARRRRATTNGDSAGPVDVRALDGAGVAASERHGRSSAAVDAAYATSRPAAADLRLAAVSVCAGAIVALTVGSERLQHELRIEREHEDHGDERHDRDRLARARSRASRPAARRGCASRR